MPEPAVLVVGPCTRSDHEAGVRAMAEHWPLAFLDEFPVAWQAPHARTSAVADLGDPAELVAAGRQIASRVTIGAIVALSGRGLTPAARLAEALGVPGPSVDSAAASADRSIARLRLADAGIPGPTAVHVGSPQEAAAAAHWIGYPVVVKPAAHTGFDGVVRVDEPGELPAAWASAVAAGSATLEAGGVLVEAHLDGPELNLQCVTAAGRTRLVAVVSTTFSHHDHFMPVSHLVTSDHTWQDDLTDLAQQAVAAIGVVHGVSHVQIRMTPTGPKVADLAVHLPADRIPELVHLATGVDLVLAAARTAAGQLPDLAPTRTRSAAIGFVQAQSSGRLTAQKVAPELWDAAWFEDAQWHQPLGASVEQPPASTARLAHYIVTGADAEECLSHAHRANSGIRATVETDRSLSAAI